MFKCPDTYHASGLIGCGKEFDGQTDNEGWLDCPHCGLAFKPMADRASQRTSEGRHRYNAQAVQKAIESSNRSGRKISSKEARAIHSLLKGR